MSRLTGMTWVTRALSILNLSEMTGQLIPIIMRILVLIKTNHPGQSNGFSAKPLGKCRLHLKNVWFSLGLAGQF